MFCNLKICFPESIIEAVNIKNESLGLGKYLAGGTDILVEQNDPTKEKRLICLDKIKELDGISFLNDSLYIGSLVCISQLEKKLYESKDYTFSALMDGISQIGSTQIRNVATIGGNICSSLPSADSIGPLMVLDSKLVLTDGYNERVVRIGDFCTGVGKNILANGEILKAIIIPFNRDVSSAYIKHGRRNAMEIALVGASCALISDPCSGVCNSIKVTITTAGVKHINAVDVEEKLLNNRITDDNISIASKLVLNSVSPRDSFRCSAAYRKEVLPELVKRAIKLALIRRR
ncbi:MAG: FAD binding domain-containing protein [Synergistota bacterium]|nr:FAD binding domain-containing protein [Synergistota bacterium]